MTDFSARRRAPRAAPHAAPHADAAPETRSARSTHDRALDLLSIRPRSVDELRRALIRKGEPVEAVDVAIERLRESGLLDDAIFARQLARSKALGPGHSRRRIQQELARRGVARDVSASAIGEIFEEERVDESVLIERVARKKLRLLGRVDDATRKRRLFSFLVRRGYDTTAIQRVLRLVLATDVETEAT